MMRDYSDLVKLITESGFQVIGQMANESEPRVLRESENNWPCIIQIQGMSYGCKHISAEVPLEQSDAKDAIKAVFEFMRSYYVHKKEVECHLEAEAKRLNNVCRRFGCEVKVTDEGLSYARSNEDLTYNNALFPENWTHQNVYLFSAPQISRLEDFVKNDRRIVSSKMAADAEANCPEL